jgi:hypothetical protein
VEHSTAHRVFPTSNKLDVDKPVFGVGLERLEQNLQIINALRLLSAREGTENPFQTEVFHSQEIGEYSFHEFTTDPELICQ